MESEEASPSEVGTSVCHENEEVSMDGRTTAFATLPALDGEAQKEEDEEKEALNDESIHDQDLDQEKVKESSSSTATNSLDTPKHNNETKDEGSDNQATESSVNNTVDDEDAKIKALEKTERQLFLDKVLMDDASNLEIHQSHSSRAIRSVPERSSVTTTAPKQSQRISRAKRVTSARSAENETVLANDHMLRRSKSLIDRAEKQQQQHEHEQQQRQQQDERQQSPFRSSGQPSSRSPVRPNRLIEEENNLRDDDTLLLVAKTRAAMGDQIENNATNGETNDNMGGNNTGGDPFSEIAGPPGAPQLKRGRQVNDAHELQRPAAYSKSPGDLYRRNRTFEKQNLTTDTNNNTPDNSHKRTGRLKRIISVNDEDGEDDRKPAAKPKPDTVRNTTNETMNSSDSESEIEEDFAETGNTVAKRKARRRHLTASRTESMSDEDGEPDPLVARGARRRSTRQNRSSMRLSMLAKSYRWNSNGTDTNSSSGRRSSSHGENRISSDQSISTLAEQSVANFVAAFRRTSTRELPIAAQVVPPDEDLEELIRNQLEEELKSQLEQELTHFKKRLKKEVLRRSSCVQIADPIEGLGNEELAEYAAALETDNSYSDGTDGDRNEDEDQVLPLNDHTVGENPSSSVRSRRMPYLGNDFKQSIRQSIRGLNLNDELLGLDGSGLAEAQVIGSDDGVDLEAALEPGDPLSRNNLTRKKDWKWWKKVTPNDNQLEDNAEKMATKYIFSSQGLLASLFVIFLLGAFVGAGSSILALESA